MATDPSSSATGLNYDGPSVRTNESGGVPAMYTETPVLPATMMVQPPRPPVPLRVAKVSAAGRDAAVEKSIERLLTVSRKEGNTVYRDGCAVAHEATPRNDDRLCSAIYEKVCDPAIALADLSQTELRILRGKVALANHRKQLEVCRRQRERGDGRRVENYSVLFLGENFGTDKLKKQISC